MRTVYPKGALARPARRPNPYRRAIANAIMLEQAWDRLATFSPCGPPPFQRIVPEGAGRAGRGRLVLPKPLDDQALRRLHDERLEAIRTLHGSLSPTLNVTEALSIDALMEESTIARESEQYHVVERRRHVRSVNDAPDVGSDVATALAKEADRPLTIATGQVDKATRTLGMPDRPTSAYGRDSISIDLVVHSLIEATKVDRSALHREIAEVRRSMSNQSTVVEVHSPSRRSNTGRTLVSLGKAFPPATFRIVGLALDVVSIDIEPVRADGAAWRYSMSSGRHTFSTRKRPYGTKSWDLPGRSLAVATGDSVWHPTLVVETAVDGVGYATVGSDGSTSGLILTLVPSRTHIDPPGSPAPIIHATQASQQAVPLDQPRTTHWRHLDAVPVIEATLARLGMTQQRRIELREGVGLDLRMAAPNGGPMLHRHPIVAETIEDGNEAIVARVEDIVAKIRRHHSRGLRRPNTLPVGAGSGNEEPAADPAMKDEETSVEDGQGLVLSDEQSERIGTCARVDALLADLIRHDPVGAEPELHFQEGIACIGSATIGDGVRYRLERFDRTMGKATHAIATVEIDRPLGASMVERLRDGSIGLVVTTWPGFAKAQVRRVTRDEIATLLTIRVPLVDRS